MISIIKTETLQRKNPLFTLDSGLFITLLLKIIKYSLAIYPSCMIEPNFPRLKSLIASIISALVFMTNGP